MRRILVGLLLPLLAACTPADIEYCRGFGVEGTAEYGKCLNYFHQQQAAFDADRASCERQADATYPQSLYDRGGYGHSMGTVGPDGKFYAGQTVFIDPDYQHNREVDRLRMRIIAPCMSGRGWNSPEDWQAGRHAVTPQKRGSNPLPWLK